MKLSDSQIAETSPLVLAYLGDAVWELYVRNRFVCKSGPRSKANTLHRESLKMVNAEIQAQIVKYIDSILTEEERDVVRRGRNVRPAHPTRPGVYAQYRQSTGFEALIGFLFVKDDEKRLEELMDYAFKLGLRFNECDV